MPSSAATTRLSAPGRLGRTLGAVTGLVVGVVDVFVVRPLADGWRVLVVQRGPHTRCPGAWETVHGRIEPGERPEQAAVREVREETGLPVERLYNVTVQPFYLHRPGVVQLAVVFTAFVALFSRRLTRAGRALACGGRPALGERRGVDAVLLRVATRSPPACAVTSG